MAETVTGRAHPALPSAARRVFPRVFPCILLAALCRTIPARLRRGRQSSSFLMSGRGMPH